MRGCKAFAVFLISCFSPLDSGSLVSYCSTVGILSRVVGRLRRLGWSFHDCGPLPKLREAVLVPSAIPYPITPPSLYPRTGAPNFISLAKSLVELHQEG